MKIYCYSKCSTCKKALSFLKEKQIAFILKEIDQTPPTLEELETMLHFQKGNLKRLFNTSGNVYKALGLAHTLDQMPKKEALTLLSQHGMLVKRPFLLAKNFGLLGFQEKTWLEQFECKI